MSVGGLEAADACEGGWEGFRPSCPGEADSKQAKASMGAQSHKLRHDLF